MKPNIIFILILKSLSIIAITIAATFVMALFFPPPKGTAFDGLDYVLKPVYVSSLSAVVYFLFGIVKQPLEKKLFYAALCLSVLYVVLLYLHVV